jgi:hypothetical protein
MESKEFLEILLRFILPQVEALVKVKAFSDSGSAGWSSDSDDHSRRVIDCMCSANAAVA